MNNIAIPEQIESCPLDFKRVYFFNMDIGWRLDKAMKDAGYGGKGGQTNLARVSGVPQPTISRILKGGGKKEPEAGTIKKLAKACGVNFSWLNEGIGEQYLLHGTPIRATDDAEENPLISRIRKVKLKISAGISGFAIDPDFEDGNPIYFRKDWIESRGYKVSNLIAIVVQGQSMEPTLNQGDTVVINTADTAPRDGDVYAINYEGEAVVKRMIRDSGVWWLSSDNQDKNRYPMKQCSGDGCIVIGKVIHKQSEHI